MTKRPATSRRRFLKGSAATIAGVTLTSKSSLVLPAEMPNSLYRGVQLGTITYSYRSMPDQSAEAILGYVLESGINAIELMGTPGEEFAGAPANPTPAYRDLSFRSVRGELSRAEETELEAIKPTYDGYVEALAEWRATAPMDGFRALRRMYEKEGVGIYAFKPDVFAAVNSDAEIDYGFKAAKALGATHCTTELPDDPAQTLRLGRFAQRHGIDIAYHTHEQASPDIFDEAFSQSIHNRSNIDLGHYVAAPKGGDPLAFLRRHHDRIASIHLKDRQTPAHGAGNLPWGEGDTPLDEILQLMRDEAYEFPATIELEYAIPEGSNAVDEVIKCVEFCKAALDA